MSSTTSWQVMWSCDSAIEVPFQRDPDLGARAVKEYPLVALGYVERLAGLLGAAARDVAHRDHRALGVRQRLDRGLGDVDGLAPQQPLLGPRAPISRVGVPVSGERLARRAEPLGLDGRFVFARGCQRRERHAARLAAAAGQSGVDEDLQDPGLERRPALEPVEALQ